MNRARFGIQLHPSAFARFYSVEGGCEPLLLAVVARSLPESRPADAGRTVTTDQVALRVLAHEVIEEDVLGDDDVSFQSEHFSYMRDTPGSVTQARGLHHDVYRSA